MENTTQENAQVSEQVVEQTSAQPAEQQIPSVEMPNPNEGKVIFKGVSSGFKMQEQEDIFAEQQQQTNVQSQEQTQEREQQVANQGDGQKEIVVYRDEIQEEKPKVEVDPFELLGVKEDDYFRKLVDAYKNDSLNEFLIKTNIDYDQMSDEEIMGMEIEKQFSTLDPSDKQLLLQKKLQREFNLGSDDETDERVGKLLLKAEADKIRDGLKTEQAQYMPKPNPNSVEAKMQAQAAQQQQIMEEFKGYVLEHPATKQFETNRLLQYGVGDTTLNYEVNQNVDLRDLAIDTNKFFSMFAGQDGKVDIQKFYKVANYAASMEGVEKALINLGRSQGEKRLYDELKNTKVSDNLGSPSGGGGVKIKSIDGKPFQF
jgi:hypothetical protein